MICLKAKLSTIYFNVSLPRNSRRITTRAPEGTMIPEDIITVLARARVACCMYLLPCQAGLWQQAVHSKSRLMLLALES